MQGERDTSRGKAKLEFPESLAPFAVSKDDYLAKAHEGKYLYLATGVVVFRKDRLLLLQRAETDSFPGCWEVPGGACDDDDETVLHGAARELMEEAGLEATNFVRTVGSVQVFPSASGKLIAKVTFEAELSQSKDASSDIPVNLDPNEHQNYVWVTQEEIMQGQAGDIKLRFMEGEFKDRLLEAFRLRRGQ